MKTTLASILALGVLGAAWWTSCDSECEGDECPPVTPGELTTRERLSESTAFHVQPQQSEADVMVRINRGDTWEEIPVALDVRRGQLMARVVRDGSLVVESMSIELEDMIVPPGGEIVPSGLHFTNLSLHLDEPTRSEDAVWTEGGESCTTRIHARFVLSWSLVVDGRVVALGPQRLAPLEVAMVASHQDNLYVIDVAGGLDGSAWEWLGIVEFSDLGLALRTTDQPPLLIK